MPLRENRDRPQSNVTNVVMDEPEPDTDLPGKEKTAMYQSGSVTDYGVSTGRFAAAFL